MDLKLYNTLTRKKEIFRPIKKGLVSFYHCGPTVYWTQHIGNMRGMLCADIVVRTFKYLNYQVKHVRNYTDVGHLTSDGDQGEDKIGKRAKQEKISPREIAKKYIEIFEKDVSDLNILEPTFKPKATDHLQEIVDMIQILLEKGYAYSTDLAIYFDVSKAKNYTQLSGQKLEDKLKDAGKGDVSDPQKKHSADFALWFFKAGKHKNALQYWSSQFTSPLIENGQGFPGWHIECSVMANKHLGKTIDIHMGGIEHIPVHHTNEIAQSESANGVKFANYWLHNEHLLVDRKKMSKSEGTVISLEDLRKKKFNPLALRYLLLQAHYRSKINFTWENMKSAQKGYNNFIREIKNLGSKKGKINQEYKDKFIKEISDDFGVSQGLALTNKILKSKLRASEKLATLLDFDNVLGLKINEARENKLEIPIEIKELVKKRDKARKNKNWDESDKIRKEIEKKGFNIEDTQKGQKISPKY